MSYDIRAVVNGKTVSEINLSYNYWKFLAGFQLRPPTSGKWEDNDLIQSQAEILWHNSGNYGVFGDFWRSVSGCKCAEYRHVLEFCDWLWWHCQEYPDVEFWCS